MHPATEQVLAHLADAGVQAEVTVLDASAKTAALAAAQLGVPVGAIANSLVFNADGAPLLIMTSGAHRVDTTKIATDHGFEKVARATPAFVRESSGQTIGGVAPIGHPTRIRTLVDRTLINFPVIWASAGTHDTVFPMTYAELIVLTEGLETDVNSGSPIQVRNTDGSCAQSTGPDPS